MNTPQWSKEHPPSPQEIEEIFNTACGHHQNAEINEAILLYGQLLQLIPDSSLLHYNTGLAFFERKEYDKALTHYRKAEHLAPEDGDIIYNLALCLKCCGHFEEAVEYYLRHLKFQPDDADALYSLGLCLQEQHALDQAVICYEQALTINPDHISTLTNLPYIYHRLEQYDKAREIYDRLLSLRPDHPSAQYMQAVLNNTLVPAAPSEYITETFNAYADCFEESLVNTLDYRVPDLLWEHYNLLSIRPERQKRCIDLGCGTGLAGQLFAPVCDHLTGIDLSEKMLAQAEQKRIYDRLVHEEINRFFSRDTHDYDLIIAADVLSYIGDLEPVFAATAKAAPPGSIFCWSTETDEKEDYKINPTGRFSHSMEYIKESAVKHGWRVNRIITTPIRKEGGQALMGSLCFFSRE
ncbi:MAG: tetratricopeptide repeat protein [Desulfobulbaceae bacterium]|uniref:Tetratricopeptide repeat protein n=1 Tax=Candidatus Desulfatifera sulfidica TaxID=2841691 RepID=A0A8J6N8I3_9BACT|nr:tetratricopeptide repeat protein [Candidatus Desulfatifera sulfidica]